MRFSIITPTILRVHEADRTMQSVDALTYDDYEHLVVVDGHDWGPINPDWRLNHRRKIFVCDKNHRDGGASCRHWVTEYATGDYILYLDDDDYFHRDALSLLAARILDEPFGVFPISRFSQRFLSCPPSRGGTAICQMYHKREVAGERLVFPAGPVEYEQDSRWAGELAEKYGYKALEDLPPLVYVDGYRDSSGLKVPECALHPNERGAEAPL